MVTLKRAHISIPRIESESGYVDVTVKSARGAARLFAPSWDMVMNHKNQLITSEEYTTRYHAILDRLMPRAWDWLFKQAVNEKLAVMCYCPVIKPFCHTDLLIQYAVIHFPEKFTVEKQHEIDD